MNACDCCGQGIKEIKCPYKYREYGSAEINYPSFYLMKTTDGVNLNPNHQYYCHVQMQLTLCEASYCDFVVWTSKGMVTIRTQQNQAFFMEIKPKLGNFFRKWILPEILTHRLQTPSLSLYPKMTHLKKMSHHLKWVCKCYW